MSKKTNVQDLLGLARAPTAVGFFESPSEGVQPWEGGEVPAGCVFWRKAMEGMTFYTAPSDHYNCAVGCHTHHIDLPSDRAEELEDTISFMVQNRYITVEEVPDIPRLEVPPKFIAYGPVDGVSFDPDVVFIAAKPAQAMLIYEAALKAGAGDALTHTLGRPGCSILPLTIREKAATLSFGCKGNRVFTGTPDEEMYICVPGDRWEAMAEKLTEAHQANAAMENYYNTQKTKFENDS